MTSTMIVRPDQPRGLSVFASVRGWRTAAPASFSGRVIGVPSPVSSVNRPDTPSPASP